MSAPGAFSGRGAIWLIAIGGTAFLAILLTQIFGDRLGTERTFRSDASSVSAIGMRGFVRVLERLDIPVTVVPRDSADPIEPDAIPVITDPLRTLANKEQRQTRLKGVKQAVLVLPKWIGRANELDDRWIGPVRRIDAGSFWRRIAGAGTVKSSDDPGEPTETFTDRTPSIEEMQLVEAEDLAPLLAYEDGVLIGAIDFTEDAVETRMIVVADPDLIANHGLGDGDNAWIALELIARIRPPGASLVLFSSVVRGEASIWQRLFTLPYSIFTLQILLALIVVLWAGVGRFGSPAKPSLALPSGRMLLIANSADLLDHARHGSTVLKRYAHDALQDVARMLNAPRGLNDPEAAEWLDEAAVQRGKPARASELYNRAVTRRGQTFEQTGSLVRTALDLYRWRRKLTDDT